MSDRATIDASAAELDLVMTEGDLIRFNFLVKGEVWGGITFICHVKRHQSATEDPIAELTVTATTEGDDTDILIESDPVPGLLATRSMYFWDMQESGGGVTRFGGRFLVKPQVSA